MAGMVFPHLKRNEYFLHIERYLARRIEREKALIYYFIGRQDFRVRAAWRIVGSFTCSAMEVI